MKPGEGQVEQLELGNGRGAAVPHAAHFVREVQVLKTGVE